MNIFIAEFKNEFDKIIARKKFFVLLLVEVAFCLASVGVHLLVERITHMSENPISNMMLANMPINMLTFFIQIYIPLVVVMYTSDIFNGEFQDGTIRALFMRPISRFKIYAAKVSALCVTAIIFLMTLFVLTTLIKIFSGGSSMGGTASVLAGFMAYLLDIIPMCILILFIVMISQVVSSPSLAMMVTVIVYIGLNVLSILQPHLSGMLFTGYAQWHNLWIGVLLPFRAILTKMGILSGHGLIFACVGYYLFERKEV